MKVLLVQGRCDLQTALADRLRSEGYILVTAETGTDALRMLTTPDFDTVLLDWKLRDMNGLDVLREMRCRALDTPVMLLSYQTAVSDAVNGLDSGADDYLVKPFHMDECMARVRRLLRVYQRKQAQPECSDSGIRCIADLTVDTARHIVTRGGKRLLLSAKECAILEFFADHAGETLSREAIEAHLSGSIPEKDTALIPVYIHYLRRKIDNGFSIKLLHTIRSAGYMLCGEAVPKRRVGEMYPNAS